MKKILVVALLSAVPASAQRAITRIPFEKGSIPIAFPTGMRALLPAPALMAPGLAAALAHSVPSAASAKAPDSAQAPESAATLTDLHNAARGEDGGSPAAGPVFDGSRPAPVASDPAGQVSPSQSRRRGTLTYWNEVRGYGFITPKDGSEGILVVANDIDRPTVDLKTLKEGEEVDYELRQTPNGPSAVKVIPVRLLPGGGGVLSRAVAGQNPGSERIFGGADMRRRFNGR